MLKQAGFKDVKVRKGHHFDLWAIASVKKQPQLFWEIMDKGIVVQ